MTQTKDYLERRCPKLGSIVSYKYCRLLMDENLPCSKVFDCWWEFFNVKEHLKKVLSDEKFEELVKSKPKPKVFSIVEMIEEAKKRQ